MLHLLAVFRFSMQKVLISSLPNEIGLEEISKFEF